MTAFKNYVVNRLTDIESKVNDISKYLSDPFGYKGYVQIMDDRRELLTQNKVYRELLGLTGVKNTDYIVHNGKVYIIYASVEKCETGRSSTLEVTANYFKDIEELMEVPENGETCTDNTEK